MDRTINIGDTVKVIDGYLKGYRAIVTRMDDNNLLAEIELIPPHLSGSFPKHVVGHYQIKRVRTQRSLITSKLKAIKSNDKGEK